MKSVNLLKGLTGWNLVKELYREHDKKLQNSFGRIKKTDAVTIVKDGAIPIGAFVKRTRKSASTECLYRGDGRSVPVTKYMSGDTEISKLTCVSKDKKSIELVVKRLERVAKPCSVEVLASDKTSSELVLQSIRWVMFTTFTLTKNPPHQER